MGVNRVGFAIIDDEGAKAAAKQELIRRYLRYQFEYALGLSDKKTLQRAELIMKEYNLSAEHRPVVVPAREAALAAETDPRLGSDGVFFGAALELRDGTIISGSNSPRMHGASSVITRVKTSGRHSKQNSSPAPEYLRYRNRPENTDSGRKKHEP